MKLRFGFVSNSSTSSFVCRTKLSIPEIKKKLELMLDTYAKLMDVPEEELSRYKYEYVFQEPREGSEADDRMYAGYDGLSDIYPDETSVGKIIIEGSADNAVPYPLFEWIENIFQGNRIHLG